MPRLNVWSSHPESDNSRVFMSILSLRRGERWVRTDEPLHAVLWFVDATQPQDVEALLALHGASEVRHVACAAHRLTDLPSPGWTFFRTPLQATLVSRWIDGWLSRLSSTPSPTHDVDGRPWRHHRFRLQRWPNVARYGTSPQVPMVCSRLLQGFHGWEVVAGWGLPEPLLERLLRDALLERNLHLEVSGDLPAAQPSPPPEPPRWGLIRRVIARFSQR